MEVIKFIKEYGLVGLKEQLGIKITEYDQERLLVLNYCQINSPKNHPVVKECRQLILDYDLNVVSRSFDRFFNYGELSETYQDFDINKATFIEKLDGSLISIYFHNNNWHCATKSRAFAEAEGDSFKKLVYKALNITSQEEFNNIFKDVDVNYTHIFELTSPFNKVVVKYADCTLNYLTSRYLTDDFHYRTFDLNFNKPKQFKFNNIEDCIKYVNNLPNLEEGFVCYQNNKPMFKLKSDSYLIAHRIKGEGLTPNRIMELVCINEYEEYLAYFPEERKFFSPYIDTLNSFLIDCDNTFNQYKHIEDSKEFALSVNHHLGNHLMFAARKNKQNPSVAFYIMLLAKRVNLLSKLGVEQ